MTARSKFKSKKGPSCSICVHPDRARIEATRVAGASLDAIAGKFQISRDSLHRHMHRHVSEADRLQYIAEVPIQELAQRAANEGVSLLDYFSIVRGVLLQQFQLAASVNDKNGTAVLAGRLTEVLREIGRITGEIMRSPGVLNVNGNINILNHPQLAMVQANILRALAPHPAARNAVIEALRRMDSPVDAPASPPNGSEKLLELQVTHAG